MYIWVYIYTNICVSVFSWGPMAAGAERRCYKLHSSFEGFVWSPKQTEQASGVYGCYNAMLDYVAEKTVLQRDIQWGPEEPEAGPIYALIPQSKLECAADLGWKFTCKGQITSIMFTVDSKKLAYGFRVIFAGFPSSFCFGIR